MRGRKVLTSIHIYEEQLEKLKRLSAKTKIPRAVYIREGIDLVLNKYERRLK